MAQGNRDGSRFSPIDALRHIQAINHDPEISATTARVLTEMVLRADNETGDLWGGYRSLARAAHTSPRAVSKAIREVIVKDHKYFTVIEEGRHNTLRFRAQAIQPPERYHSGSATTLEAQRYHSGSASATTVESKLTHTTSPDTNPSPAVAAQAAPASQRPADSEDSLKLEPPKPKPKKTRNAKPKKPTDPRVKEFIAWFAETYQHQKGEKYIVQGGKDGAAVKRLLRQLGGNGVDPMTKLKTAAANMLADDWGSRNGDLGVLASKINSWLTWKGNGKRSSWDDFTAKASPNDPYDPHGRIHQADPNWRPEHELQAESDASTAAS